MDSLPMKPRLVWNLESLGLNLSDTGITDTYHLAQHRIKIIPRHQVAPKSTSKTVVLAEEKLLIHQQRVIKYFTVLKCNS